MCAAILERYYAASSRIWISRILVTSHTVHNLHKNGWRGHHKHSSQTTPHSAWIRRFSDAKCTRRSDAHSHFHAQEGGQIPSFIQLVSWDDYWKYCNIVIARTCAWSSHWGHPRASGYVQCYYMLIHESEVDKLLRASGKNGVFYKTSHHNFDLHSSFVG